MKGRADWLIHTMTRASRINPPSLKEGRGWWRFKVRQASQWVKPSQRQTTDSLHSTKIIARLLKPGASFVSPPQNQIDWKTDWEEKRRKRYYLSKDNGELTDCPQLFISTGAWKKKSEDRPEDTRDCVAMETKTWKRTQGPLKVDNRSWMHPRHITVGYTLWWEVHEPYFMPHWHTLILSIPSQGFLKLPQQIVCTNLH